METRIHVTDLPHSVQTHIQSEKREIAVMFPSVFWQEGFWGLGNSAFRCSPCDCDIGGAHSNRYVSAFQ